MPCFICKTDVHPDARAKFIACPECSDQGVLCLSCRDDCADEMVESAAGLWIDQHVCLDTLKRGVEAARSGLEALHASRVVFERLGLPHMAKRLGEATKGVEAVWVDIRRLA